MKNLYKQLLLLTFFVSIFVYSINYSTYISDRTVISFNIWLKNIVPSLYISFLLSDVIFKSNIPYYLYKYFKIDSLFWLSVFFGSPTNAYICKDKVNDYKNVATTKFVSLLFCFNFLKVILGIKYTLIVIISNVTVSYLIRKIFRVNTIPFEYNDSYNLIDIIVESTSNSIYILLKVLGVFIFYNILPLFLINNKYIVSILYSFLEITNSLIYISSNTFDFKFKLFISVFSISFGGLSIDWQIKSVLKDTKIVSYKYYSLLILRVILVYTITMFYSN